MKKVILEKLDDIIFKNNTDLQSFVGITVTTNKDIHGNIYELEDEEEKYYLLDKVFDNSVFISETKLLQTLLTDYISDIEDHSIYEHGYPEGRLAPTNFYEDCQNATIQSAQEEISGKILDILDEYF